MSSGKEDMVKGYIKIIAGTGLMALAVNSIYTPMGMVTGGVTGIGIMLYRIFGWPVGIVNWVINIPLLLLAVWRKGINYVKKTMVAVFLFSLWLLVVPAFPVTDTDFWMAALIGGVLTGAGLGMVMQCNTSTGGTDLAAALLWDWKKEYPVTRWILFIDGGIVLLGSLVFGLSHSLYAVIAVYITTKVMDGVLSGVQFGKLLFVISEHGEEIAEEIMQLQKRGVTKVKGIGMYMKREKDILMCVVSKKEVFGALDIIHKIDKKAFVIVSETKEVFGEGFMENI